MIKWKRGEFIRFFAQMKIRVGGQNSVDILKGDEFEYDGSILRYNGLEVAQQQIRGAIDQGWATIDEESNTSPMSPAKTSRNVAKSQTVNRDLSRVQRTSAMETSSVDEDEVLKIGDRGSNVRGADPKILRKEDNRRVRGMSITSDEIDEQDGVEIGRVRTAAKTIFEDVTQAKASNKKISDLENLSNVRANLYGKNGTTTSEGVTIKTNLRKVKDAQPDESDEGVTVGKIRKTAGSRGGSEGLTVTDTSNIREERAAQKVAAQKVAAQKVPPAKKPVKEEKITDPRVRIARRFDPSFPSSWLFTGKLSERLDAVKKHGVTPEFIQALHAAEGDQMRKVLAREFPDMI